MAVDGNLKGKTERRSKGNQKAGSNRAAVDEDGSCCKPVIIATFESQTLIGLEQRHFGFSCYRNVDYLDTKEYQRSGARAPGVNWRPVGKPRVETVYV